MAKYDDKRLLRDFCDHRDEDSFSRLLRRHLPLVQAVAMRRLRSAALAEEAAQNVFALLARKASGVVRHPERLGAWLHRAAFLEASNLARKEARFARVPADPALAGTPADISERPEVFDRLDEALQALPEADRELLLRRYWKGEDFRTIAEALGRTVEACQKRVERTLAKLGSKLGRTTPTVAVASTLATMKPTATAAAGPAANAMALTVLQRTGSASGNTGGAFSGGLAAASVAAMLAGIIVGFPPSAPSTSLTRTQPVPGVRRAGDAAAAANPLPLHEKPPRPPMPEVLASIDAGRLAPLVAFLAEATPAELREMLEDRYTFDSYRWEGGDTDDDYCDSSGVLILRQWAAIDPTGALQWSRGKSLAGAACDALVIREWLKSDPEAALAAFRQLPVERSRRLVDHSQKEAVEVLIKADPKLRWILATTNDAVDRTADPEKIAETIANALAGKCDPARDFTEVRLAFSRFAENNPESALDKASQLTAEPLRTIILAAVRRVTANHARRTEIDPEAPSGWDRAVMAGGVAKHLAATNPGAAISRVQALPPNAERDAAIMVLADQWGRTNPWPLMNLAVSLRGSVASLPDTISAHGYAGGSSGVGFSYGTAPDWNNVLFAAALEDAARAVEMAPQLAQKLAHRGRCASAHSILELMLESILSAWVFEDPIGAVRWARGTKSKAVADLLDKEFRSHLSPALTPAEIVRIGTDCGMEAAAQWAAMERLESRLESTELSTLFSELPPDSVAEILRLVAVRNVSKREIVFNLAAPEFRRQTLQPEVGRVFIQNHPAAAVQWINSLPPADRQLVVEHLRKQPLEGKAAEALQSFAP